MSKIRDLTGQQFCELTVLTITDKRGGGGEVYWLCQCSCGQQTVVRSDHLVSGDTKGCGHLHSCDKKKDLTGQQFGELTALSPTEERRNGCVVWLCQCSCGNQTAIDSNSLISGSTQSCGCSRKKDITGQRFGRWVVLEEAGRTPDKRVLWHCRCDCGNEAIVASSSLVSGHTQSCGCYHQEVMAALHTTHGLSKTPEYINTKSRERKERKRGLDSEWTTDMEVALCEFQPACVVCGSTDRMATDHVLPLSNGNGLKPGNAVRLCRSHNSRKSDKDIDELPADWQKKIIKAASDFQEHWNGRQS